VSQTGTSFSGTLDTLNGSGPNTAIVTLGSKSISPGKRDTLVAWSEDPGGVSDTANHKDTLH